MIALRHPHGRHERRHAGRIATTVREFRAWLAADEAHAELAGFIFWGALAVFVVWCAVWRSM